MNRIELMKTLEPNSQTLRNDRLNEVQLGAFYDMRDHAVKLAEAQREDDRLFQQAVDHLVMAQDNMIKHLYKRIEELEND